MTMPRTWTVLDLLRWTQEHFASKGIDTARLDAECLLAHVRGTDRLRLYVDFDQSVEEEERARFRELVRRRASERVPVAQLTGVREFWSLPLAITADVLVPRPETETLVQVALELVPDADAELRVLDVGTGSGAVAFALAVERGKARLTATDISPAALDVARRNAEALGLSERIRFADGDLYEPVQGERFDLVVSNPPYVARGAALPPELAHEPEQALFAGADGLEVLRPLIRELGEVLEAGGAAAFEVAPDQAEAVQRELAAAGFVAIQTTRDLARRPRVVSARHPRREAV
jgi:release factor glutamine methyltransferase